MNYELFETPERKDVLAEYTDQQLFEMWQELQRRKRELTREIDEPLFEITRTMRERGMFRDDYGSIESTAQGS